MDVLLNGLSVFADNWQMVAGILTTVLAGQFVMTVILRSIFGDHLTRAEYFSLGLAGWIVPITITALIWILWGIDHLTYFILFMAFLFMFILLHFKPDFKSASSSTIIIFALFLLFTITLRLAFVFEAIFPSYFDSAQHYAITKSIMENGGTQMINSLSMNYYHLGFHFITASFASVFDVEITRVILIFGQVILALIPVSFFFIVRYVTQSNRAGLFTVVLSAFGWYMPTHAVDWGKYPALMSLSPIPFVFGLAYLLPRISDLRRSWKRYLYYAVLGTSILISAFIHSRSLILIVIVVLAWSLSVGWMKLPPRAKRLFFIFIQVVILLEIIIIQRHGVLSLLFDPYLNKGILTTFLVVVLSIFAYRAYPQLMFTSLLVVCLLVVVLFIPVNGLIPGRTQLTLMDRPYVEMILFMPLSLLGGLGLTGLEKSIKRSHQRYAVLTGIGLILIYAIITHEYHPSDCCVIVGNNDVAAMAWMENQLPVDARIGVASVDLKVVAKNVFEGEVGADAGIWITPLTDRVSILLPSDLGFDQPKTLDMLCRRRIDHLFVGERGQTFDREILDSHPAWYRPLLSMPRTGVYEVIGCKS